MASGKGLLLDGIKQMLTHLPLGPHKCVSEVGQHCFRWWFAACSAPSHYLTNADLLSVGLVGTNFSEIGIGILLFSFKKMYLKLSSATIAAILSRGRWVNLSDVQRQSREGDTSTTNRYLKHQMIKWAWKLFILNCIQSPRNRWIHFKLSLNRMSHCYLGLRI